MSEKKTPRLIITILIMLAIAYIVGKMAGGILATIFSVKFLILAAIVGGAYFIYKKFFK